MKKISFIAAFILLIVNNFLTPLAAYATGTDEQAFTLGEAEVSTIDESLVKVTYNWDFTAADKETETTYDFQLPENIKAVNTQTNSLQIDGVSIGSYTVSGNQIKVSILAHQTVNGTGTIEIDGKKEITEPTPDTSAEEKEVKPTESATVQTAEPVMKKLAEQPTENAGVIDNTKTPNTDIKENILTSSKLTFTNTQGGTIDKVDRESIVAVDYTYALPNGHTYTDGATFKFHLPNELEVYETVDHQPLKFGNDTIGEFSVAKNGEVTVVFNDFIETHSNVKGTIQVLSKLSEKTVITDDKTVTVTPIEGQASVDIPINYISNGSTIDKNGIPDKKYNAKTINWTVDFNKNLDDIKSAVLSDPIQNGQELQPNSIKIYKLITHIDGSVDQGEEVTTGFIIGKTTEGKDFQINLGDIQSAYRVVYTTNITDQDKTQYANTATLSGNGYTNQTANATVTVGRGTALSKSSTGYDGAKQTVDWQIKYNYNEKTIPADKAILTDYFNGSQELVDGSLKVYEVVIKDDGSEGSNQLVTSGYSFAKKSETGKNGFELTFDHEINKAYKVVYQTKAIYRVYDKEMITNNVINGDGTTVTGNRDINQQILTKQFAGANDKDKTASWKVTFNNDSYLMKNVILNDNFTNKGLTFLPNSLVIKTGKITLQSGTDYTVTPDNDGFKIEFKNDITTPYTIEYKTIFNYEERADITKTSLDNKAVLTWKDEENNEKSKDATATFTPDTYTQSNGYKYGSYNAVNKEITWNVGVNYNLKTLSNASVEDYILDGQKLDLSSIVVSKMSLTGGENGVTKVGELEKDIDYTVETIGPDQNGNKGFKVIFKHDIQDPHQISYKTSLKDTLVKKNYHNTATVYSNNQKVTDFTTAVSVNHGGEFTTKSGEQKGKIINWKVNINFGQSSISDVVLTDNSSENQSILEDSFHLYDTTVDAKGNVTKGKELTENIDYTITKTYGKESFELKFKNAIDAPYILEYQSLILDKVGAKINNAVKLTGKQITTENTQSSSTITVKQTTGMGTGQGEVGSLSVKKVAADDPTKFLQGAVFSLIDEDSNVVIKTLTTDENGIAIFDKLLFGNYLLKELLAPKGYVIDLKDPKKVEITGDNEEAITNSKIIRAVELTKVDSIDNKTPLKGAEFELQLKGVDGNYQAIAGNAKFETDENGKILVNNLEPGDYRFVETKAPENYLLDQTPVSFTIKQDQTATTEVKKTNERGKGNLTVTKVDAADQTKTLEGAKFELYNSQSVVVGTKETGKDGKITFSDLPYDHYTLKEIKAPTGFAIDKEDSDLSIALDQPNKEITVRNNKIIKAFKLKKVDANNTKIGLKNAEFKLMYKTPGTEDYTIVKDKLVTDENGEIYVDHLAEGTYQLIETKAPAGYLLDSKPIEFTITSEQINVLNLTKSNVPIPYNPGNPGNTDNPDNPGNSGNHENPTNPENPGNSNNSGNHSNTPGNSDENQPTNGSKNNSGKTDETNNPTSMNHSKNTKSPAYLLKKGQLLPQTGTKYFEGTLIVGITLILLGLGIIFKRKNKKA